MNTHHTKMKGDAGVTFVIHDLTTKGYHVCVPITEHAPYDLIATNDAVVKRIQVKYREVKNGCMVANLFNAWGNATQGCVVGERYDPNCIDIVALTNGVVVAYVDYKKLNINTINIRVEAAKKANPNLRMLQDYQSL